MRNPLPLARELGQELALALSVAARGRLRLGVDYARLCVRASVARALHRDGGGVAQLGELRFHFGHFASFLTAVREILVEQCYDLPLQSAQLIVDVGANIGVATVRLAVLHPSALIHAFEPDPSSAALLRRNVEANGLAGRVEIHELALGAEDGRAPLFADEGVEGSVHSGIVGREWQSTTSSVEVRRPAPFFEAPVDFLKLDVEGAELDILRELATAGALDRIGSIAVEVHVWLADEARLGGVLGLLEEHGFRYTVRADEPQREGMQDVLIYARRGASASG